MLFSDYLRKTESRADAGPIEFASKRIRSEGVTMYLVRLLTGVLSDLTASDAITVTAGGENVVRCSFIQWRARLARLSKGSIILDDAGTVLPIPLYLLDFPANWPDPGPLDSKGNPTRKSGDILLRYNSQFPGKLDPAIRLTTSDAGGIEAQLGWEFTDEAGLIYPRYISQAHAMDDSNTNQTYDVTQPGQFRGFCLTSHGLNRVKLEINGSKRYEYDGGVFPYSQQLEGMAIDAGNEKEVYFKIHGPEVVGKGTRFEADTTGDWDPAGQIAIETQLAQP